MLRYVVVCWFVCIITGSKRRRQRHAHFFGAKLLDWIDRRKFIFKVNSCTDPLWQGGQTILFLWSVGGLKHQSGTPHELEGSEGKPIQLICKRSITDTLMREETLRYLFRINFASTYSRTTLDPYYRTVLDPVIIQVREIKICHVPNRSERSLHYYRAKIYNRAKISLLHSIQTTTMSTILEVSQRRTYNCYLKRLLNLFLEFITHHAVHVKVSHIAHVVLILDRKIEC
jgi:hypothetical protein